MVVAEGAQGIAVIGKQRRTARQLGHQRASRNAPCVHRFYLSVLSSTRTPQEIQLPANFVTCIEGHLMGCAGFLAEDYGLYVLGSLEDPEREQIAEHLAANCPVCTAEVAQYRVLWSAVGAGTPLVSPSRKLRSRVIQSVGGRASWWAMPLPIFAGAAVVVLAVASGWFLA